MRFLTLAVALTCLISTIAAASGGAIPREIASQKRSGFVAATAAKGVTAYVDKSEQTMTVHVDGWKKYTWPVSTARRGKHTPNGKFTAYLLSRHHRSSLYNNAPMPYSIFFHSHYAIHGTDQVSRLGRPASAGCIRLHPSNAAILFALTQQVGLKNMKVVITD